jgi:hypothetical protein
MSQSFSSIYVALRRFWISPCWVYYCLCFPQIPSFAASTWCAHVTSLAPPATVTLDLKSRQSHINDEWQLTMDAFAYGRKNARQTISRNRKLLKLDLSCTKIILWLFAIDAKACIPSWCMLVPIFEACPPSQHRLKSKTLDFDMLQWLFWATGTTMFYMRNPKFHVGQVSRKNHEREMERAKI